MKTDYLYLGWFFIRSIWSLTKRFDGKFVYHLNDIVVRSSTGNKISPVIIFC